MTFLAALRCDDITAPCVLDGPINGESFLAYVERILAPTPTPGDIVVMANLGSRESAAIDEAIRAKGARRVFPPKYSPDLNPIEPVFSKLKRSLRKAKERSIDTLWRRIATLLDHLPQPNAPRISEGQTIPQLISERLWHREAGRSLPKEPRCSISIWPRSGPRRLR